MSPMRELAFVNTIGTKGTEKLRLQLDWYQEDTKTYKRLLEYLTAKAVETVVNDFINE